MNQIEIIERDIHRALPSTWTRLRRPRNPEGTWWLDAKKDEHWLTVEWSPKRGFGLTASALGDGYGEGPEETFEDREGATTRVLELLRTKGHTVPPKDVLLRELRAQLGVTQEELAERLGVQQAAVSRLERRGDITLSSLQRFVAALGGELEISIRTPSGDSVRLSTPRPSSHTTSRACCAHVEQLLAPPATRVDRHDAPPQDMRYGDWLKTFETAAKSRWRLTRDLLCLTVTQGQATASVDLSNGVVSLDEEKARALASEVSSRVRKRHHPANSNGTLKAVLRHLLAHEVGHCVEGTSLHAESDLADLDDTELRADAVAGWLAATEGDDALTGSIVSRLLGCQAETCSHPKPEERSMAYLLGYSLATKERMNRPMMKLLVVRTADLERSRAFYQALGLRFRKEKHGNGPAHYSCDIAGTVLELYPTQRATGGLRLGLCVPFHKELLEDLHSQGFLSEAPMDQHGWSSRVIHDPDGNAIELQTS